MKVAIVCEFASVNGGENSMLAMLEHLPEITPTFIAPAEGRLAEALAAAGYEHQLWSLHDAQGRRIDRERVLEQLQNLVAHTGPDLIHANSLAMGRLTGRLRRKLSIPTTAHLRDILNLNRSTISDLNVNDRLIAVSAATREHHLRQGLDADRTQVIYNGIDPVRFGVSNSRALHRELRLSAEVRLVAAIGQIALRKGQDVFVSAAIRASEDLPDVHWLIVGERYSSKPETVAFEQQMKEQIERAGLADRFHWLGYRRDVPLLLSEIDVLVHAARQEPLGRVLLEAGAAGVTIVATDVGGTREILTNDRTALLVPPDDAAAIAERLTRLLTQPQLRADLSAAVQVDIASRFDVHRQACELEAQWRRLADRH